MFFIVALLLVALWATPGGAQSPNTVFIFKTTPAHNVTTNELMIGLTASVRSAIPSFTADSVFITNQGGDQVRVEMTLGDFYPTKSLSKVSDTVFQLLFAHSLQYVHLGDGPLAGPKIIEVTMQFPTFASTGTVVQACDEDQFPNWIWYVVGCLGGATILAIAAAVVALSWWKRARTKLSHTSVMLAQSENRPPPTAAQVPYSVPIEPGTSPLGNSGKQNLPAKFAVPKFTDVSKPPSETPDMVFLDAQSDHTSTDNVVPPTATAAAHKQADLRFDAPRAGGPPRLNSQDLRSARQASVVDVVASNTMYSTRHSAHDEDAFFASLRQQQLNSGDGSPTTDPPSIRFSTSYVQGALPDNPLMQVQSGPGAHHPAPTPQTTRSMHPNPHTQLLADSLKGASGRERGSTDFASVDDVTAQFQHAARRQQQPKESSRGDGNPFLDRSVDSTPERRRPSSSDRFRHRDAQPAGRGVNPLPPLGDHSNAPLSDHGNTPQRRSSNASSNANPFFECMED